MNRPTEAEELAGTLRWCADARRVEGLHPEKVRRAADLLVELEKRNSELSAALAANEHVVMLDPKPKWKNYSVDIRFVAAITSPVMYEASYKLDARQVYEVRRDLFENYLPRVMIEKLTRQWRDELAAKARSEIAKIDWKNLETK